MNAGANITHENFWDADAKTVLREIVNTFVIWQKVFKQMNKTFYLRIFKWLEHEHIKEAGLRN